MLLKKFILISFLLSSINHCYSQDNRLPNWNQALFKWEKRPIRWTIFSNKPSKIETQVLLNNNNEFKFQHTVYSPNYSFNLFKIELVPLEQYSDSGAYHWSGDTLELSFIDSSKLYFKKGSNLIPLGTDNKTKLTYSIPRRFSIGVHYGPEAIAPSINTEFFPIKNKNVYFGIEAGLFIAHLNFGIHFGLQRSFFLAQIDLDYSIYGDNSFISVNPKVGLMKYGLYFKTGPSLLPFKELNKNIEIEFPRLYGVPLNFEIGYCFKINSKLFDL
jgi:hypothetical protein